MILDKLAQSTRKRVELEKANIPLKLVKEKALNMPKGNLEFEKTLAQKGIWEGRSKLYFSFNRAWVF